MNNVLFAKILVSFVSYVSVFGLFKFVFEKFNGKPDKYIVILDLKNIDIKFNKYEVKLFDVLKKAFNSVFWFTIWISVYRIINSNAISNNEQFILTPREVFQLGMWVETGIAFIAVLIIITAAIREQIKQIKENSNIQLIHGDDAKQ